MPLFFVPALVLTAVVLIVGVGPIAARLGGWKRLEGFYRAPGPFEGDKIVASGAMGAANYGFSLLLGADARGFSLETTGFVRTGHAPLFIPWPDIKAEEVSGLLAPRVLVTFTQAPGVVLRLRRKTVLELRERSGAAEAFKEVY